MSRGLEIDDDRGESRGATASGHDADVRLRMSDRGRARDPRVRSANVPDRTFVLPRSQEREPVTGRGRSYRLRDTESRLLVTAGIFRVVFERDLRDTAYRDTPVRLDEDVRHLVRNGLLKRHTVAADHKGRAEAVLSLTREGQELLEDRREGSGDHAVSAIQPVTSGWRKISEVVHDASLYRMYQVEAAGIEAQGGVTERVVLGEELKRQCYADASPHEAAQPGERQAALVEAAARLELPVVDGHVEFPDLRVEYEMAGGERTHVDLELVTDAYRPGQIAGKQRAGFTLYSAQGSSGRGIASLGGEGNLPPRAGGPIERSVSSLLSL